MALRAAPDALAARAGALVDAGLPAADPFPRWLAPPPRAAENFGLRFGWPIAAVTLVGTAFSF